MKFLYIFPFLLLSLYSQTTPKTLSKFGDLIYLNTKFIEKLQNISEFQKYSERIKKYVKNVEKTEVYGFDLQTGLKNDQEIYLKKLRKLIKTNDYFIRKVKNYFYLSIENGDSKLFQKMIDSGLLDTKKHSQEIVSYYYKHKKELQYSAAIRKALLQDKKLNLKIQTKILQENRKKVSEAKNLQKIRNELNQKSDVTKQSIEQNLENTKN